MSKRTFNAHNQTLLDAGFRRHRYSVERGYRNKDRLGPPTWRKPSNEVDATVRATAPRSFWNNIERNSAGWVCYTGHCQAPDWSSPVFPDSTSALVYAEIARWGRT